MKKRIMTVLFTAVLSVSLASCGSGEKTKDAATEAAQDAAAEAEQMTTEGETADGAEKEAEEDTAQTAQEDETEKTGGDAALEDYQLFAESVRDAVAAKDLEALSQLVSYPVYAGSSEDPETGAVIETKEDFIALGADTIFTDTLLASMEAVNPADIAEVNAGFVMMGGEEGASIIFNAVEEGYGITGLSY